MSDTLVAKGSNASFQAHPEGQFIGQCVDVIDLGQKVEEFPGTPSKLAHKCALVFRTGERNDETNEYIDIAREFTVSMGDKANLRKFLEQWRGKPYTSEEAEQGVPVHKLEGVHALLTVSHKTSGKGRVYANITACVGVPKQMRGGLGSYLDGYERAEYWATRRDEYAKAARAFNATVQPSDDDFPAPLDDMNDEGLPF